MFALARSPRCAWVKLFCRLGLADHGCGVGARASSGVYGVQKRSGPEGGFGRFRVRGGGLARSAGRVVVKLFSQRGLADPGCGVLTDRGLRRVCQVEWPVGGCGSAGRGDAATAAGPDSGARHPGQKVQVVRLGRPGCAADAVPWRSLVLARRARQRRNSAERALPPVPPDGPYSGGRWCKGRAVS